MTRMAVLAAAGGSGTWLRKMALLLLACMSCAAARAFGQQPEAPHAYATDLANVLSVSTEQALNAQLRALEDETSAQLLVLTIDSTAGVAIADFATETASRWRLGQAQRDDGALLVIAVRDRRYWIAVGYGLEAILPDGALGSIGRSALAPALRQGDYDRAVTGAVAALAERIRAGPDAARKDQRRTGRSRVAGVVCVSLTVLILIVVVLAVMHEASSRAGGRRRWRGRRSGVLRSAMEAIVWSVVSEALTQGSRKGGWSSGTDAGSWGGGFGGFSGGGGGSFGGGGAGGSW